MNLQDWLTAAEHRLKDAGLENGKHEARALAHAALEGRIAPLTDRSKPISAKLLAKLDRMLDQRAARQPLSQITGKRSFWKHDFLVTRDTLDPRPDTEALVEAALNAQWGSVLDLGTGTGAILISLLADRPEASGVGTDISEDSLAVARQNAAKIGVKARFVESDWFANVTGRFDLIVSNPPYIALSEMDELQPEVRDWEPHLALTDGADGLTAYRQIATDGPAHLNNGGTVMVEIGWQQGETVSNIFRQAGAVVEVLKDLNGNDRVIRASYDKTLP
ncbi:peptide chain release factor N(5)-glutamine methyltransferase [Paracoccus albus]|uniref:peptide chain release factor N(5)-glutamine methyltransferase n=1 Tax=Paracoccus albus TaxID=3017784 RepID=UPI0022F06E10|nr:peptide chain release factor N(5)-glutamine methyltransferase [Paracoccus albus]WBU60621.1 peptide chain release factor N(5)-glutamine methyltransferase [Paracoccus albus]